MKSAPRTVWSLSKAAVNTHAHSRAASSTSGLAFRRVAYTGTQPNFLRVGLEKETSRSAGRRNYTLLGTLVNGRLRLVLERLGPWTPDHPMYRYFGVRSQSDLNREAKLFRRAVGASIFAASDRGYTNRSDNPLFWNLRNAFVRGDSQGLDRELKYSFQSFLLRAGFSKAVSASHRKLADMRVPYDWYPNTRAMQRTIHLHVGPTNSGKTYNALKALENSKTGLYAGPLRLLAHEVYSRFKAKGLPCALITGEEQRIPNGVPRYFTSCTVEMTPIQKRVDVAVIDEIQMMADPDRGWAWTQAVLGVQAKELHLCGEERAVDIIKAMCDRMGDECVVHRYERLNPLHTMNESLNGNLQNLQKGDCVVSFSRVGLHALKSGIEAATGRRCAIVYGSLPPETRAQQAALFNDPDNDYDFLVASDAIGMGLNLEIKRVVFESVNKFDGSGFRTLSTPEVKQIGGRAGRYRTANRDIEESSGKAAAGALAPGGSAASSDSSGGWITTLDPEDLNNVQKAFKTNTEPIQAVGLLPPSDILERFISSFPPHTPVSFILLRMREIAKVSEHFHLCNFIDLLEIADIIQELPLSIHDRCIFLTAPVHLQEARQRGVMKALAACVANMKAGYLVDIKEIDLEIIDVERGTAGVSDTEYLGRLEALHKAITLYLWLTYRFRGVFVNQNLAFHVKSLVEEKITSYLDEIRFKADETRASRGQKRKQAERQQAKARRVLGDGANLDVERHDEDPGNKGETATLGSVIADGGQGASGGDAARV